MSISPTQRWFYSNKLSTNCIVANYSAGLKHYGTTSRPCKKSPCFSTDLRTAEMFPFLKPSFLTLEQLHASLFRSSPLSFCRLIHSFSPSISWQISISSIPTSACFVANLLRKLCPHSFLSLQIHNL